MPSKAPFSKDFGRCGVGLRIGRGAAGDAQVWSAAGTVLAVDQRYLERWAPSCKKPVLRQMGVDEIKDAEILTVASNLETGEPLWFDQDRKQETLDEFFRTEWSAMRRGRITAACVDMWEPLTASILS